MSNQPVKNAANTTFQLATITLPSGAEAQAIVLVDDSGAIVQSWPVTVSDLPLPEGAATEETLLALLTALQGSITVTGPLTQEQLQALTIAISAETLPLPNDAATASNQAAANVSLAAILAKLIAAPSTEAKQDSANTKLDTLLGKIDTLLTAQANLLTAIGLQAKLTDSQPITGSISVSPDVAAAREATQQDVKALADTVVLLVETIRNNMPMPDNADRMRCNVETGTINVGSITTLPTLAAVTTVATVTTIGNQTNMGGYSAVGLAMSGFNVPALETLTRQVIVS